MDPVVAARCPCTVPGPRGIATASQQTILGAYGARRPGYWSRDPVFGGVCEIARFAAGGRRALLELPAAQANAFARPPGCHDAVAIRRNRQASPLTVETTKTAVSDFSGYRGDEAY